MASYQLAAKGGVLGADDVLFVRMELTPGLARMLLDRKARLDKIRGEDPCIEHLSCSDDCCRWYSEDDWWRANRHGEATISDEVEDLARGTWTHLPNAAELFDDQFEVGLEGQVVQVREHGAVWTGYWGDHEAESPYLTWDQILAVAEDRPLELPR